MRIQSLFTEDLASVPESMPVSDVAGEPTGEHLKIITMKSKAFICAHNKAVGDAGEVNVLYKPSVVQSLIVDWSFEDDCTTKNKILLLENAPWLIDQIVGFAYAKTEALTAKKKNSSIGLAQKAS